MDIITEWLERLGEERAKLANMKADAAAMLEGYSVYQMLRAAIAEVAQTVDELEKSIRSRTVMMYEEGKELPEFVGIRKTDVVTILDAKGAKQWCLANMTTALVLDVKKFEAAVISGDVPEELATVVKEPKATIATKLPTGGE